VNDEEGIPNDAIRIQPFCYAHRHDLIVHKLERGPNDTFMVYEVTAMMLLFQWAAASPASPANRKDGTHEEMQKALSEFVSGLGCLACWDVAAYERAAALIKKGLRVATDVVNMKAEDPGWPRTPADMKHLQ
jgi:hypothetical protein